jgi:group I intron endonuclease
MVGIYKIQSSVKPSRSYIGSAVNITERWRKHINDLQLSKHCNSKLQNHYNKYGISDLQFSVLIECSLECLLETEQCFLDSNNPFFNICKIAGRTTGYKHSESAREKMRGPKTPSHKRKLSEAKKGKSPWNKGRHDLPPQSEETRKKKSKALTGKPKVRKYPRPAAKK